MRRLLREPLLHFLALGLAVFALHRWVAGPIEDGDRIVVTRGRIQQLAAGFERVHQRAPIRVELDGLIADAVREEVLYREAMAMGLDKDDTIVRRRLRQKLEFISEDVAPLPEPTEAQLLEQLRAQPGKYRSGRRYSLELVYLNPAKHGDRLAEDAATLLAGLRDGARADGAGDAFLLPRRYERVGADDLSRLFGPDFEAALQAIPVGRWQGPVPSGLGMHLVLVQEREEARAPLLAEVREAVRADWRAEQRRRSNESFYAELSKHYEVRVERDDGVPRASATASTAPSSR